MQHTTQLLRGQQLRLVPAKAVSRRQCFTSRCPARVVRASAEPDQAARMQAMQSAMNNPEVLNKMKDMMSNPQVMQEMQQMQAVMSNPDFIAKMQALREDPELKPMFEEMRAGGMAAMVKYMNDPTFLAKIGEKMGDVAPAAAPEPEPEEIEINNILDAVRYSDLEAIEDFIAIGKGGFTDPEGRTALHYAAAYNRGQAVEILTAAKADLAAKDQKGNMPLHYAVGYGQGPIARALIAAGADVSATNDNGQTPAAIIRGEPRNPLNQDAELLAMLEGQ